TAASPPRSSARARSSHLVAAAHADANPELLVPARIERQHVLAAEECDEALELADVANGVRVRLVRNPRDEGEVDFFHHRAARLVAVVDDVPSRVIRERVDLTQNASGPRRHVALVRIFARDEVFEWLLEALTPWNHSLVLLLRELLALGEDGEQVVVAG